MIDEQKIKLDAQFYDKTYQEQLKFELKRLQFQIEQSKKQLQQINNLIQKEYERISKHSKS